MEECHQIFSIFVLKGKLRGAIQFVCEGEKGRVLQPDELAMDCTVTINKAVTLVLEGKHPSEKNSPCATLETYG